MNKGYIQAIDVSKSFGQEEGQLMILDKISGRFDQGATYAITGVSGAGKSTFLHLLAGLEAPTEGKIIVNGHNIAELSALQRTSFFTSTIGLMFQLPYLIRDLSVLENIMLPGMITNLNATACRKRAYQMLEAVNLTDKAHSDPRALSGGQQQRVALARALFNKPMFLLADEPTGSLDEETGETVIAFILACQQEWSMGLIIASHDRYVTKRMQNIICLYKSHAAIVANHLPKDT